MQLIMKKRKEKKNLWVQASSVVTIFVIAFPFVIAGPVLSVLVLVLHALKQKKTKIFENKKKEQQKTCTEHFCFEARIVCLKRTENF